MNSSFAKKCALNGIFLASLMAGGQLLSACLFGKKASDNSPKIILRGSILLDRLNTGETVRLAFKTDVPANCEIKLWSQEADVEPTAAQPRRLPCQGLAQTNFVEPISSLSVNTLYTFEISAWSATSSSSNSDKVKVKENDGRDLGRSLIVLRLNKPLYSAEVHRYKHSESLSLNQIKTSIRLVSGCYAGISEKPFAFSQASDLNIKQVSSQGYATSQAINHPSFKESWRLGFNAFQNENRWQLNYKEDKHDLEFFAKQAAEIYQVEMTSQQTKKFDKPNLIRPENILNVDVTKPLSFRWSGDNLSDISYVLVQVGHKFQKNSFHCIFDATKQIGVINANSPFLLGLDKAGGYDVVLALYSAQLQIFPGAERTPWLLTSYDWRAAVIQRI